MVRGLTLFAWPSAAIEFSEAQQHGSDLAYPAQCPAARGYDLWTVPPIDDGKKRHPVWSKLHGVLAIAHLYDWIWMIDDDALIMNTALPLTDFIDDRFNLIVRRTCGEESRQACS